MIRHTVDNPSIKWVRKAKMWCKTWFEQDGRGDWIQKQVWSMEKP